MTDAHWLTDPRPDLAEDTALWRLALREALPATDNLDGLYGSLRGFRSEGARLERTPSGAIALRRGAISEAEYPAWRRRYLVPHGDALTRLLDAVGNQERAMATTNTR